jgi:hypothetical protein
VVLDDGVAFQGRTVVGLSPHRNRFVTYELDGWRRDGSKLDL